MASDIGYQVPIHSMLSEIHNINYIQLWLNEFIRLSKKIPNQFTSDMSLVLLNSAAKSFAQCRNLDHYINVLFQMHSDKEHLRMPPCFIRIDKNHLIKHVAQCKQLHGQPSKVKSFYVYCVVLLMECSTLKEAEDIIFATVVVALSTTEGRNIDFFRTLNHLS